MRKKLYKGKYRKTNTWIYWETPKKGFYEYDSVGVKIYHPYGEINEEIVVTETACEYVKEDCKGNKVFENDIVKCEFVDEELGTIKAKGVIEWDSKSAQYLINVQGACKWLDISFHPEIEVVGNIFDEVE